MSEGRGSLSRKFTLDSKGSSEVDSGRGSEGGARLPLVREVGIDDSEAGVPAASPSMTGLTGEPAGIPETQAAAGAAESVEASRCAGEKRRSFITVPLITEGAGSRRMVMHPPACLPYTHRAREPVRNP